MSGKRQKTRPEQLELAFPTAGRGEAPRANGQGTETLTAKRAHETPADAERLVAGGMEGGLVSAVGEGVPQGSLLSPVLSNLVLDERDQELERCGLRFVRYADDRNVYVRSE